MRLWRERRGEIAPEDLSDNLVVQLGTVTENLNRSWYKRNTGHIVKDVQRRVHYRALSWMAATLDGGWCRAAWRSRPSSCCPGLSWRKPRPRNMLPNVRNLVIENETITPIRDRPADPNSRYFLVDVDFKAGEVTGHQRYICLADSRGNAFLRGVARP